MSAPTDPAVHEFGRTTAQRFALHAPNTIVRAILRSPLHRLLSARLMLLTYTGRRTGEPHTIPVQYSLKGADLIVTVGWPERKVWWRSVLEPSEVSVRVAGRDLAATAQAHESAEGVTVTVTPRR